MFDWFRGSAKPTRPVQLLEQVNGLYGGGVTDPDAEHSATQLGSAYVRRLSASKRDFSQIEQDRALTMAYELYDTNPVAKRILEMVRDFVVGEGITVTATPADGSEEAQLAADNVQAVIDGFWSDPVNRMDLRLPEKVLELGLWGEQFWPVFVNPVSGHVRLGLIDPQQVKDVQGDPENAQLTTGVILKAEQAGQSKRYDVVAIDEDPNSPSFGRFTAPHLMAAYAAYLANLAGEPASLPPGTPTPLATDRNQTEAGANVVTVGALMTFRVNCVSNARRGRTDLLTVIDWIDGLDQVLFNEIDRSLLIKSFIWDVKVTGLDDADIADWLKKLGTPSPGAVRVHNEEVEWSAVAPNMNAHDTGDTIDQLTSHIGTGAALPKHWLNGTIDLNRATSGEMSEPTVKHLTTRQTFVKDVISQLITFVLDQAELHTKLPRRELDAVTGNPAPWSFQVNAPDLRAKDMNAAAQALLVVSQAMALLMTEKVVDVDVAQEVIALLVTQFGYEVDLTNLRKRLEDQAAKDLAAMKLMTPAPMPGAQPGTNGSNGARQAMPGERPPPEPAVLSGAG